MTFASHLSLIFGQFSYLVGYVPTFILNLGFVSETFPAWYSTISLYELHVKCIDITELSFLTIVQKAGGCEFSVQER